MIANCAHDERGKYNSGTAGDQTGTEYRVINWYNRPWTHVIRPKSRNVGNKLAEIAKAAANNNKIGYDQYQRLTYYEWLKRAKWDPSKITTPCETDCTASTAANVIATGYQLGIIALQGVSPKLYSGNIRKGLMDTGYFWTLTERKYLTSDKYLLPGDILLYENHHAAINLSTGSAVAGSSTTSSQKGYTGAFPELPSRGYFMVGDGYKQLTGSSTCTQIKRVQQFLNWAVNAGLTVDGDYGAKSSAACIKFQKVVKIEADGKFGKQTLAKAKSYKK